MAKSTPGAQPGIIRFKCNQCGTTLKVSSRLAERYIDCPKCKQKTHVPKNQAEADEEAHGYGVNRLAYDTTGSCRQCGAKMPKKAIVCTECGYDYRSGKAHEVVDKTKLPKDYPTWKIMLSALGGKDIVQYTGSLATSVIVMLVVFLLLGLGPTYGIGYFVADPTTGEYPGWVWYITMGVGGICLIALVGLVFQNLTESASQALYKKLISAVPLPMAIIFGFGLLIPALAIPGVFIGVFTPDAIAAAAPSEQAAKIDPTQAMLDQFTGGAISVLIILGASYPLWMIYTMFGAATFSTDLTINPIRIFTWIGKGFVDILIWLFLTAGLLILSLAPAGLVFLGGTMAGIELIPVAIIGGLLAVVGLCYFGASASYLAGLINKRHL